MGLRPMAIFTDHDEAELSGISLSFNNMEISQYKSLALQEMHRYYVALIEARNALFLNKADWVPELHSYEENDALFDILAEICASE